MSSDASRNRSPPSHRLATYSAEPRRETFAFDFPPFGGLSGESQLSGQGNYGVSRRSTLETHNPSVDPVRPGNPRQGSSGRQISPGGPSSQASKPTSTGTSPNNSNGSGSIASNGNPTAPQNGVDSFAGLFSPSLLNGTKLGAENNDYGFSMLTASPKAQAQNTSHDSGTDSNSGLSRVFRFNSGSTSSNTDSPSQSSLSQFNANSSCHTSPCDTSPEPSHPSFKKEASQSTPHNKNINLGDASNDNGM